MKSVQNI